MWALGCGRSAIAAAVLLIGCDVQRSANDAQVHIELARMTAMIGATETATKEYLFGSISSVAADSSGRLYVADRLASNVRVYSSEGVFLRTVGRKGEGPGEFQVPSDLLFNDGHLWVRDLTRIQRLAAKDAGDVPDSVDLTLRLGSYANTRSQRGRVVGALYYYPRYFYPLSGGARYFYEVFDSSGIVDTVAVPIARNLAALRGASYRLGRLSRSELEVVSSLGRAPFEPAASWDITQRGTILLTSGDRTAIHEVSADGDTVGTFVLPVLRQAVPREERKDSARALETRLRSMSISISDVANVSEYILGGELPDSLPTVLGVHVADDDRVWVRIWPSATGVSDFLVLDVSGDSVQVVRVPVVLIEEVPPYVQEDQIIGVTVDADTGVQIVAVATFDE